MLDAEQKQKVQDIKEAITDLTLQRPVYVKEAKERAKKYSKSFKLANCPCCNEENSMEILHVFPPLTRNLEDPIDDTDWHIKCNNCENEDWITMEPIENRPDLVKQYNKQEKRRKKRRRK